MLNYVPFLPIELRGGLLRHKLVLGGIMQDRGKYFNEHFPERRKAKELERDTHLDIVITPETWIFLQIKLLLHEILIADLATSASTPDSR